MKGWKSSRASYIFCTSPKTVTPLKMWLLPTSLISPPMS
uniref:Uncharacterized protein n=1 Tax=Arundo donax TaxID=35708 RepID=A0A0A9AX82_ARUDO